MNYSLYRRYREIYELLEDELMYFDVCAYNYVDGEYDLFNDLRYNAIYSSYRLVYKYEWDEDETDEQKNEIILEIKEFISNIFWEDFLKYYDDGIKNCD